MPMNEIGDEIPLEKRPTVVMNGSITHDPAYLKSLNISHPTWGLGIEVGAHPSNKFAAIGIQMNKIHWYTIYFTLAHNALLVGMIQTLRSIDHSPFWSLIKEPKNIGTADYALEEVGSDVRLDQESHKDLKFKVKKLDLPNDPINLNPELFFTDDVSGIRFRCIRVYNLPMKMTQLDVSHPNFIGTVELPEKIQEQLIGKQEEWLLDLTFVNARQAKLIGDGISQIGIGILEEHLATLK